MIREETPGFNGGSPPGPLDAALAYRRAGLSLIPIATDGSKRPDGRLLPRLQVGDGRNRATWKPFQERLPSEAELRHWFDRPNPPGVAVIGGEVSGHLEQLDFDREAATIFPAWCELVEAEVPGLTARLSVVTTPREPPGYHVRYRCPEVAIPGNMKLAMDPAAAKDDQVLIETRGEGGYALAPGCPPSCHPSGRTYDYHSGPKLSQVQSITAAEREVLIRCARSFDRSVFHVKATGAAGLRPGDDYNERGPDWPEILEPHGWVLVRQDASRRYWRRPGKDGPGWSATTGVCTNQAGHELFACFSSNAAPFEGPSAGRSCSVDTKFSAYAKLNHGGDFQAAAKALAGQCYGDQRSKASGPSGGPTSDPAEHVWGDPQPIPDDLQAVVPFDYNLLPEALREFVADVAERMQCPPDFPAVATMEAIAGVVGKKIGIRPKRQDDWLVIANLWGAVIGRPGIMKTPAIRQPIKFLHRLQLESKKRYEQEMRDYEDKRLAAEAQKKAKKKAVEEAIRKKQDPLEVAKNFPVDEPEAPTPKRYLVNDSTVEKLGELLNLNPNGLTVFRDELIGLLRQLDKEGQEGARAFYLEAWDGLGTFTYDRIVRGTLHIESVTVSMLGGIQPGRLLDYLGAALKGGAGDDGLLQRFQLLVYPDVDKKFRNVDRWPDTSAKARVWAVFQRLDALDPVVVGAQREEGDDGVPFLHFDPMAQGLFDDWRAALEETVRSGDEHPAFESHLAKYRSLVPSLALLIHLVDGAHGPVGEEATRKAIAWVSYLESHARRIYGIAVNSAAVSGKALAKRILKGELKDGFTLRDIYRKHWAGLSEKQAVEQAVDLLVELGWLRARDVNTGGKPKTYYDINPALLTKTAPEPSAKSAKSPPVSPIGTYGTDSSAHFQATEGDDDSGNGWGEV
jgi:putative DNA primase/helicase